MTATTSSNEIAQHLLDRVVIRFAGDSGDGMQLVGDRFTELSALFGNDLATLPDYPAEIRAPAGTVVGVSSFQVHISSSDVVTPGDAPNVLVAMNPAALRLDPLPPQLPHVLRAHPLVVCAEPNLGQLTGVIRDRSLCDVRGIQQVSGLPFTARDLERRLAEELGR